MKPCEMPDCGDIYALLYRLGETADHTGFFYTACAIRLAIENPERLLYVTKWLYPDVARYYKTNWHAVERGIRLTIQIVWVNESELLSQLAGHPLLTKPRPAEFIQLLATHLKPLCVA